MSQTASQSVCKLSHVPPVGFSCPRGPRLDREENEGRDSRQSREILLVARDFVGSLPWERRTYRATELFLPARLRLGPRLRPRTVVTPEAGGGARPSSRCLPGQAQERRPWGLSRVGHKSAGLGLQVAVPALSLAPQVLESHV